MGQFLDKEKLTNHIIDSELRQLIIRSLDLVSSALYHYEVKHTKFMNPYEIKTFVSILKGIDGIGFHCDGGHMECERQIVYIYPDYFVEQDIEVQLSYLFISGNFKYRDVSHRDYLGSLLSLGITRENIGDILISNQGVAVIALKSIGDFITFNLERIANVRVAVKEIEKSQIVFEKPEMDSVSVSVSSLRLDSIISSSLNISREKSLQLIKSERVRLNYELITSGSKTVAEESLISVKGFGRFIYSKTLGESKKGKTRILINKYGK